MVTEAAQSAWLQTLAAVMVAADQGRCPPPPRALASASETGKNKGGVETGLADPGSSAQSQERDRRSMSDSCRHRRPGPPRGACVGPAGLRA